MRGGGGRGGAGEPPAASTSEAPPGADGEPERGPGGCKKQFDQGAEYMSWDYLRAPHQAPGARAEKRRFKPGWKEKRREEAIQPYRERLEVHSAHEARAKEAEARKRQERQEQELEKGFNPIKGTLYDRGEQEWKPATDPWSHVSGEGKKSGYTVGPPPDVQKARALSQSHRDELRYDRVACEGLTVTKKEATVYECLFKGPTSE